MILDEPTLQPHPDRRPSVCCAVIADLKARGVCVVSISHRLNEIERCADRVVVPSRRAAWSASSAATRSDHATMIRLMIGRDLKSLYRAARSAARRARARARGCPHHGLPRPSGRPRSPPRRDPGPGRPDRRRPQRARWRGLSSASTSGSPAGPPRGAATDDPDRRGTRSRRASTWCPRTASAPVCYSTCSIAENIGLPDLACLCALATDRAARGGDRQRRAAAPATGASESPSVDDHGGEPVRAATSRRSCSPSGCRCGRASMIFDEPTRGVDVGAKSEIYRLMRELADRGVAILMISSDMEEVIGVSDRIAVMHEGGIAGFLDRQQFSEHNVLRARRRQLAPEREAGMQKKELGLLGPDPGRGDVVAVLNPRFLSPINLVQHGQPDRPVRSVLARPRRSSSSPAASSCRSARFRPARRRSSST